jgi:hypothetical protein
MFILYAVLQFLLKYSEKKINISSCKVLKLRLSKTLAIYILFRLDLHIDAAQIQISKSKSQITKCQIPNPKFNFMCQIPNPKSQIFFLSAKSQIQVPNPKSQIILDLGSIYRSA